MERARALVCDGRGAAKAAALAIIPLASAVAGAQPVTLTLTGQNAGVMYAGSYQPPEFELSGADITNGIRISGRLGELVGDDQAPNRFLCCGNFMNMNGEILGPLQLGSTVRVTYNLTFTFSGGNVDVYSRFMSSFSGNDFLFGNESNNLIVTSGVPVNGSVSTTAAFNGGSENGVWFFEFYFNWQNYLPTDTFNLQVNHIDVEVLNNLNFGACCRGANLTGCGITTQAGCATQFGGVYQGDNIACRVPGTPARCCTADFNGDGSISVQDLFDFLAAWFAQRPTANVDGVNGVTVQDLFDYLALWFRGCSF